MAAGNGQTPFVYYVPLGGGVIVVLSMLLPWVGALGISASGLSVLSNGGTVVLLIAALGVGNIIAGWVFANDPGAHPSLPLAIAGIAGLGCLLLAYTWFSLGSTSFLGVSLGSVVSLGIGYWGAWVGHVIAFGAIGLSGSAATATSGSGGVSGGSQTQHSASQTSSGGSGNAGASLAAHDLGSWRVVRSDFPGVYDKEYLRLLDEGVAIDVKRPSANGLDLVARVPITSVSLDAGKATVQLDNGAKVELEPPASGAARQVSALRDAIRAQAQLANAAPPPTAEAAPQSKDVGTRLQRLKQLHDDGHLSDGEYETQRGRILGEL